jgi:GTP cyclohydrolase IA
MSAIRALQQEAVALPDPLLETAGDLLRHLGEDVERAGLADTPRRVAESLRHLTEGSSMLPEDAVGGALFESSADGLVTVRDIPFYSLCEHHLLPFFGYAHVGYLPAGRVIGLSKLPRLIDVYAHRLQLQERLTQQVADAVLSVTGATGVGVVMQARHLCVEMRGVSRQNAETVTSALLGDLRTDTVARTEFLELARDAARSR